MNDTKKILGNEGQSSVEFIISFIVVVGFVFMYVKVAMNFTNGYVVHYANYMASRALLVYEGNNNTPDGGDGAAKARALEVWKTYNIEGVLGNAAGSLSLEQRLPGSVTNTLFVGTVATYQDRFTIFGNVGSTERLTFKTESFLGREPSIAECVERTCEAFTELGISCGKNTTVIDNGC
ncbi:MAG: hypothetical protein ACJAT2_003265 [Bacteriovoracaceae bacterium]|jgi:hypothetical protein